LLFLRKVDNTIDWKPIEKLLMEYYQIGKSKEGERTYSPLLLFKCLLLQKWFRIKSDPELENLICDRLSFRNFLKLPMDYPSPDHSIFSRFRKRISKETMVKINSEVLKQFHQHGISINKSVAVDARLVKLVNRPLSNKKPSDSNCNWALLKADWTRIKILENIRGTMNLTGLLEMISPPMDSKSILLLIQKTDLFFRRL